ncbi:CHRD domain-containing protein [Aridibaculum aurantiacum]|uniref:CHRD domain-containing protein n=1 Tax=Aridibaculum aurantiacum TaxID=2810307 RepID=UPI001A970E9B|nr:CHRD domain-containing protein [Aridibaculum aurantiacum]
MKKSFTLCICLFLCISSFSQFRYFYGVLSGANEVPPNSSTASGVVLAIYNTNNRMLEVYGNYNGLTSTISGSHIHLGAAGTNGGVIVGLANTGGTSGTLSGSGVLTASDETQLLAGNTYANVHSTTFPGGEIRSQLVEATNFMSFFFNARLQGAQEVPPNSSTATGGVSALIDLNTDKIYITGSYSNLSSTISGSHLHIGSVGINGPVAVTLVNSGGTSGTLHAAGTISPDAMDSLVRSRTYINVHSTNFPGGEIRGQLVQFSQQRFLGGRLSGANEVPPNSSVATGTVIARYNDGTGEVELTGDYQNLSSPISGSHIHLGSAGINGPVIVTLTNTGGTTGTLSGSGPLTQNQRDSLLSGRMYVNVHSTSFPGGEIRAQLIPGTSGETNYFRNGLSSSQEVPANPSAATGTVTAIVDRITGQVYVTGTYSGLTSNITGSHIHRGVTGANGPVILTLINTGGTSGTISGSGVFTQALVDSMINGFTYANVHSTTYTGGEIRAQLGNLVLPVKLQSFSGYKDRNKVVLVWNVLSEQQVKHYEIEQQNTRDGSWMFKSTITARGAGSAATYKADDVPAEFGQPYLHYRLKMVDKDGRIEYSPVARINFTSTEASLVLLSNPVKNTLHYTLGGLRTADKTEVSIIDQHGRRIHSERVAASGVHQVDISRLGAGVYILVAKTDDHVLQQRFVKQ